MTDRLTCDHPDCGQPIPNGEAVVRSRNFEQRTFHRACAERVQRVPEQRQPVEETASVPSERVGGVSDLPTCPNCGYDDGYWPVCVIPHSGERALQCPTCETALTETFLRDVQGIEPFKRRGLPAAWPEGHAMWVMAEGLSVGSGHDESPAQPEG
jgi:hypothetical protein